VDDIYFANCQKCEIFLIGVKILGTITGGLFHDKSKKYYINYMKNYYYKKVKNIPRLNCFNTTLLSSLLSKLCRTKNVWPPGQH